MPMLGVSPVHSHGHGTLFNLDACFVVHYLSPGSKGPPTGAEKTITSEWVKLAYSSRGKTG